MFRGAFTALALLAMLTATLPTHAKEPAAKSEPTDTKELLRQARDLWLLKKDYNAALAAFNRAVDAAPRDGDVRLQRAQFFEVVSDLVREGDKEKFKKFAREDYEWIAEDAPDTMRAGVARDGLTRLAGKTLLVSQEVTCPNEAAAAHERAESLYGSRRFSKAAAEYEKASAGCPAAASYWVDFADAYYGMEQYDKAKELFRKAIDADPWSRSGHRFLADTESHLENVEAAVHEAALAVVSDPAYEAAWASLRSYASVAGRRLNRVYGKKTEVTTDPAKEGNQNITITLPAEETPAGASKTKAGAKKDTSSLDDVGWVAYGMSKAVIFTGTVVDSDASGKVVERKVDPKTMTALDIERIAVRSALQTGREIRKDSSSKPGPFWSMMDRADRAGFLDEAIFLHMLDAPLAAEYPAFREKNAARLVEYLETIVVPKK